MQPHKDNYSVICLTKETFYVRVKWGCFICFVNADAWQMQILQSVAVVRERCNK